MKSVKDVIKERAAGFAFNLVSLVVLVIILLLVIYVFAAFIEPSSAPDASSQDFNQNILGANNANNLFTSSLVAANNDGSIIERLEYLWANRASFGSSGGSPYINWNDCQRVNLVLTGPANNFAFCGSGYTLVDHHCSVYADNGVTGAACYLSDTNSLFMNTPSGSSGSGSIKCCKYIIP